MVNNWQNPWNIPFVEFGCNQNRFFLLGIHKKSRCHDHSTDESWGMDYLHKNQPVCVWHRVYVCVCVGESVFFWGKDHKKNEIVN